MTSPSFRHTDLHAPFAVAPRGDGVALYGRGPDTVRCGFSNDGIRWGALASGGPDAADLRPLCAGTAGRNGGPSLFCVNDQGQVVPAHIADGALLPAAPFQPVAQSGPWYEAPPDPGNTAIIWDARAQCYRAFFCARRRRGHSADRRGCIGMATSPDLSHWQLEPPIFAPNRFPQMASPHVLTQGERTVLFYATPAADGTRVLRFALAPHLEGPYERGDPDSLARDCRTSLHSAATALGTLAFFGRAEPGGGRRPTVSRPGRLAFDATGRPQILFYDRLLNLMGQPIMTTEATLDSGEILVRVLPRHGADCRVTTRVRSLGACAAGVLFRTTVTGSDNITLWLDFEAGTVDMRRGVKGRLLGRARRPLFLHTDYSVAIWAEGAFADIYLNDEWILTGHTEARVSGGFGVAVRGGEANFSDLAAQAIVAC